MLLFDITVLCSVLHPILHFDGQIDFPKENAWVGTCL